MEHMISIVLVLTLLCIRLSVGERTMVKSPQAWRSVQYPSQLHENTSLPAYPTYQTVKCEDQSNCNNSGCSPCQAKMRVISSILERRKNAILSQLFQTYLKSSASLKTPALPINVTSKTLNRFLRQLQRSTILHQLPLLAKDHLTPISRPKNRHDDFKNIAQHERSFKQKPESFEKNTPFNHYNSSLKKSSNSVGQYPSGYSHHRYRRSLAKYRKRTPASQIDMSMEPQSGACRHFAETKLVWLPGCVPKSVLTTRCQGTCQSRSAPFWNEEQQELITINHCTCCSPNSMRFVNVRFRCPQRPKGFVIRRIGYPFRCACRPCAIVPEIEAQQPYDYD